MDPIAAIVGGSLNNLGVLALIFLQVSQMFFDNKKNESHIQVNSLTKEIQDLRVMHENNKKDISALQIKVFALESENSTLRGLLSGLTGDQELKESLIKDLIKKTNISQLPN